MGQAEKAQVFRQLHERDDILVLPNAYDAASACLLADAGAAAIATTSGGCAFSLGYPDGERISRDEMCAVVQRICRATSLPVSADMEAGYGESAESVAETVLATIAAGAVGINIEDSTKGGARSLIDLGPAVERIKAARKAADTTGISLLINARTDAFSVRGDNSKEVFVEAVSRANAYLEAGADCAFVIGVRDRDTIGSLVKAINGPVNILAGPGSPTVGELARLGVKRVTVGSSFAKAALTLVRRGAEELLRDGTYGFAEGALGQPEIHKVLEGKH